MEVVADSGHHGALDWQTAALTSLGPIEVAHASLDHPALVLRLGSGHDLILAAVSVVLAGIRPVSPAGRR